MALLLVAATVVPVISYQNAHAAALAKVMVRFDRIKTSTATTGTVCASPGTSSTDVKSWTVSFPTGYSVSTTAANWQTTNISTTNLAWPSGAVAWPNAASATVSAPSGQDVTWTNSSAQTMNTGSIYCYNWTNSAAISTSSSATSSNIGSVTTTNSSSTTIDSAQYATATISNDQIVVTATVPPTFSFTLSANTDALGTLGTGSVAHSPTPRTVTIGTNARNGWVTWASSALTNGGLRSATTSYTIPSTCSSGTGTNTTLSAGTEGYNTGVTGSHASGTGTVSIASIFDGSSTSKGGGLCGAFQTIASSNGTASGDVLTLTNNVAIGNLTPAANDYTDTITVVGAGLF
jgi:hypothetical protein